MRTCLYIKNILSIYLFNIALQNTDFGVLQKSSKHFLISIFFPCPTPRSVLRASNNEDLFLSIFIYNIAIQNTDFGVLQKSSKHFLISIFFHMTRWKCSYNAGGLKDLCLLQWQIVWVISQWFYKKQISCLDGLIKHGTLYTANSITCIMLSPSQQSV